MSYLAITGQLAARTAVHIGSGAANDLTDALLRRDARGNLILPGSGIAGALRSLITRLAPRLGYAPCRALNEPDSRQGEDENGGCTCPVCHLFGDIQPQDSANSASSASRLIVHHARLAAGAPASRIRDGVGIDRVTGAAARAAAAKFDLEVLPARAVFDLVLELEDADATDEVLLAAGLAEWQAGRAWLGGRTARGLGAFQLRNVQVRSLALDSADGLLAYLESDKPWELAEAASKPQSAPQTETGAAENEHKADWLGSRLQAVQIAPTSKDRPILPTWARTWVEIEGVLQAEGSLLTNDSAEAAAQGFDHAPLLAQSGAFQQPLLTGAGLRGVLRSQAERIARTLATHNAANGEAFLAACPACDPLRGNSAAPLASCDSLLRKGQRPDEETEAEDLCLACRLFGSPQRGSRLYVEDAPYNAKAANGNPRYKIIDFLAIDRFTGGGAEHLKFDALALWKPAFTLRLHLDNAEAWELGWLLLVLRDLMEGQLHVGYGAAKGFGRVRLGEWKLRIGYLDPAEAFGLPVAPWKAAGSVYAVHAGTIAGGRFPAAGQQWVEAFTAQLDAFRRPKKLALQPQQDSYFDGSIEQLYAREVAL